MWVEEYLDMGLPFGVEEEAGRWCEIIMVKFMLYMLLRVL